MQNDKKLPSVLPLLLKKYMCLPDSAGVFITQIRERGSGENTEAWRVFWMKNRAETERGEREGQDQV